MNYSQENYLSDLFLELRDKNDFKNKSLKTIVDISNDVNEFLEWWKKGEKIIKNISIRVFEIIALSYYSKNTKKEDIVSIAQQIVHSDLSNIYYKEKKKLKTWIIKRHSFVNDTTLEIKNILSEKLISYDKSKTNQIYGILHELINEFSIDKINNNINPDYIDNENSKLYIEKDKIQTSVLDIETKKIFIKNIDSDFYESMLSSFYQRNINKEKLQAEDHFSIINQYIFSEFIFEIQKKTEVKIAKNSFYSKKQLSDLINELKLRDDLLDTSNIENIKDNIFSKIINDIWDIKSAALKQHLNKWLKNIISKISEDFLFDIKLMNSYDFFIWKTDYSNNQNNKEELVMWNKGDLIYNFDNLKWNNDLLLLEDIDDIKNNISVLSPNKHNFENNILKLIKWFSSKIKTDDYEKFFDNLLINWIKDIKLLLQFTNWVQSIDVLNDFYIYLKNKKIIKENNDLLDELVEYVILDLERNNIWERFESDKNSYKRINLVLFYLWYWVGNNWLVKIFQNTRISSELEYKILKKLKKNKETLELYEDYLTNYLDYSNNLLSTSINKEYSINKKPNNDKKNSLMSQWFSNPLEYINIYNWIKNIRKSIEENIENDFIKKMILRCIDDLNNFKNISNSTYLDKFNFFKVYIWNEKDLLNEKNIITHILALYIIENFDYESSFILMKIINSNGVWKKELSNKIISSIETHLEFLWSEHNNSVEFIKKYFLYKEEKIKKDKLFFEKINLFNEKYKKEIKENKAGFNRKKNLEKKLLEIEKNNDYKKEISSSAKYESELKVFEKEIEITEQEINKNFKNKTYDRQASIEKIEIIKEKISSLNIKINNSTDIITKHKSKIEELNKEIKSLNKYLKDENFIIYIVDDASSYEQDRKEILEITRRRNFLEKYLSNYSEELIEEKKNLLKISRQDIKKITNLITNK